MTLLGQLCMLGAFVSTGYAAFAFLAGRCSGSPAMRRSGVAAGVAGVGALGLVTVILAGALLVKDFRFAYVAQYSNRSLPWYYSLSALWVGQAGSLLLWAWWSGLLAVLFHFRPGGAGPSLRDVVSGLLMGNCCFLVATMVFAADPMAASITVPRDGAGLSPLLQHPAMLLHPPVVLLGYALWAVPFALAVATLASPPPDSRWIHTARRWALVAWAVLGAGILLGAEWAYEELGWGGYWSWDPVENGSLIPWLTGTALIHTLLAWQHRGVLKRTAIVLAVVTFGMCNFATFLTRSGVFSSLHAFSHSPIGWLFLLLMVGLLAAGSVLLWMRHGELVPANPIAIFWSRETMVVLGSAALLLLATATGLGTLSVALSDVVLGRRVILGVAFYNRVLIPTGLLVLAATGTAPLLKWGRVPDRAERRLLWSAAAAAILMVGLARIVAVRHPIGLVVVGLTTFAVLVLAGRLALDARRAAGDGLWFGLAASLHRRRRPYAGFVIHMGFFCLAAGITGSSLGTRQVDARLHQGETFHWAGWSIRFVGLTERDSPDRRVVEAKLEVRRGASAASVLTPAVHWHSLQNEWTTEVAIQSAWRGDLYTILHGGEARDIRVTFVENPMMRWIWLGGAIMVLGVAASGWPIQEPQPGRSVEATTGRRAARRLRPDAAVVLSSSAPHHGIRQTSAVVASEGRRDGGTGPCVPRRHRGGEP